MESVQHTVLCVDDEKNILSSLKRLLRGEDYTILTADSAAAGLEILAQNDVHVIISDQRMPEMSGTEFLAEVKENYPDIIRIILSGFTDVDSIAQAINTGHIYKFLLKPWNDHNLKTEIRQALNQFDLMAANQKLHLKVVEQNEELKKINETLEERVEKRTKTLELQNQALELSHAILEQVPMPVVGISADGMIAFVNLKSQVLRTTKAPISLGNQVDEVFSSDIQAAFEDTLATNQPKTMNGLSFGESVFDLNVLPLTGYYQGRGIILAFTPL